MKKGTCAAETTTTRRILRIEATLESLSPYSQSCPVRSPKNPGESPDAYDLRTRHEHLHLDDRGEFIVIPRMALRESFVNGAAYLGTKIPGRGPNTYTKRLASALFIENEPSLGITPEDKDVYYEHIYANADGVRGSGKRVWRWYPTIRNWKTTVILLTTDPELIDAEATLQDCVDAAGKYVGIGRYRAEKHGMYGRYGIVGWTIVG